MVPRYSLPYITNVEIADKFKVTLVEALPSVLPSFSKSLIDVSPYPIGLTIVY